MRVVMLSDVETIGGAATAASRLAEGLARFNVEVIRLIKRPDAQKHRWMTKALKLIEECSKRVAVYLNISFSQRELNCILKDLRADVINIHNLHGAGWWPNLVSVCVKHAPTIWTLHDMWSFTGRCAYSYDCRRFISGCNVSCPTPNEYPNLSPKLIAGAWKLRRRLFEAHPNLVAVCPSRWLAGEAAAGLWKGHRVEVIPYGLPLNIYKPLDKNLARAALGIDMPGLVLLASAQNLQERRKGGSFLVEAVQKISHRPLTLVTMGHGNLPIKSDGIYLHSLGYIDHERTKVLAYNAADIFIHSAPVDNLPLVVMEAIACGTPVVGFPIGGVVDMVRPGQTGWLAEVVTPEALAAAIDKAIQDLHAGIDLRHNSRAIAKSEWGIELQAHQYLELFRSILV